MKTASFIFGFFALILLFAMQGCGGDGPSDTPVKETKVVAEKDGSKTGTATPEKTESKSEGEGEEKQAGEPEEEPDPIDTGPIPFDRMWPDHPLAEKLLRDPEKDEVYSYWKNARKGDWLRFLTHQQQIALMTVVEKDGDALKVEFRHFDLKGQEEKKDKPDIRPYSIKEDDEIMKSSLLNNPYVTRSIAKWKVYNGDKTLDCEMRFVDNPTGEKNENLYSWDVRCGGFVKMRRGNFTYITLIDYGDAENPPTWENLKAQDMLNFWYVHNVFTGEPVILQSDPPEGEMPEMPEDCVPPELAEMMKKFESAIGSGLSKALSDKKFAGAASSLSETDEILEAALEYAKANNFKPAIAEIGKVKGLAAQVSAAFKEENGEKAFTSLEALRNLAGRMYVSLNYTPEKKD